MYLANELRACTLSLSSCVQLSATAWTVVRQAPLSMGIPQARILEWISTSSSKVSSQPRDQTCISVAPALQADSLPLSHQGSPANELKDTEDRYCLK